MIHRPSTTLKMHGAGFFPAWNLGAERFKNCVIVAFAGMFIGAAFVFALRRVSGALATPLSPGSLILSGLLASLMAWGIRNLWRYTQQVKSPSRGDLILDILLCTSLMTFAASLTLPGTNRWGLVFFWLLPGAEEFWAWRPRVIRLIARRQKKKTLFQPARIDPAQTGIPHTVSDMELPAADLGIQTAVDWPAGNVRQQLTRSTDAEGRDVLCGWLRMDFAAGSRSGNLHVAFCPPFAATPELEVEQLDGPEARIKIAQLLPYGARLELKLIANSPESASVLVQFTATCTNQVS
jgi:hypothetical protein